MKLSIEDYNLIAEQETEFSHALNQNYFRIANRKMLQDYAAIYKRTFNKDSKILNGCNRCVLADIKALATVYFQDKEDMTKAIDEAVEEKPVEETPKKTRKMSDYNYGEKKTPKNKKK